MVEGGVEREHNKVRPISYVRRNARLARIRIFGNIRSPASKRREQLCRRVSRMPLDVDRSNVLESSGVARPPIGSRRLDQMFGGRCFPEERQVVGTMRTTRFGAISVYFEDTLRCTCSDA